MSKYGALFFNQGITEELTPYESAVFLKKIKTKPGIIKVIEGNNNAVPLIFIRVLNASNPSLSGLSEVIYENNAWCVNLIDTIQGNSAEYELYVFVKYSIIFHFILKNGEFKFIIKVLLHTLQVKDRLIY